MSPETTVLAPRTLALRGGDPAFSRPLHVGAPNLCDRERFFRRLEGVFARRRLANRGPCVRELEERLAERLGVQHCVAACNGTMALTVAARVLGLQGEVIVPGWTFVATPHSLQWLGLRPVFCDVDPLTHNLDPAKVEAAITPRTGGILAVHLWGRAAPVGPLQEIAERHGLPLYFDAAHAFGATVGGEIIGRFGACEVFSFHATKFFNTAEGGAIATDDDGLAERFRLALNFGFEGMDSVVALGINGKMNELAAAAGLTALEDLDHILAVNREHHEHYARELAEVPGLSLLPYPAGETSNHQYVVVEVDPAVTRLDRDRLLSILRAENCMARRYFHPGCHRMEPYRSDPAHESVRLPVTDRLAARVLVLPTGTAVTPAEIRRVVSLLADVVARSDELRKWFAKHPAEVRL